MALLYGERYGYRNSQTTVLAPTGTIGFMMDCDTTGIEPDLALVKYKKLVGGGMIKIVNNTVPAALFKLGYTNGEVNAIVSYIDATGTIEGAPGIKPEHLAVFDCSFKPAKGTRSIHYMGHIKMMAAAQPFLSGAISKTVNLPHEATVEEVAEAYAESWRQGIKAVAIYRDGSKGTQPLNTSIDAKKEPSALDAVGSRLLSHLAASQPAAEADVKLLEAHGAEKVEVSAKQLHAAAQAFQKALDEIAAAAAVPVLTATPTPALDATEMAKEEQDLNAPPRAIRHRLQEERASLTHKFSIAGHEGYITVGMYPNGQPGEIFIRMAKEGSTVSGLMDAFATSVSLALQHGVPLKVLCEKFAHTRFRAFGLDGQRADWLREEPDGLHVPLAESALPFGPATHTCSPGWLPKAPQLPASPSLLEESDLDEDGSAAPQSQMARLVEEVAKRLNQVAAAGAHSGGGIAPEPQAEPASGAPRRITESQPYSAPAAGPSHVPSLQDRGLYHAADAMRGMYDMGDAPSCGTCGAIMVRNGSCYRCMSCGSTSGCS